MQPVSAVVITKNEEEMLPRCLAALAWIGEVVVVDSGSTDRTVAIAKAAGARVLHRPFRDFADQYNWAAAQASHPWVLMVDADEVVDDGLAAAIGAELSGSPRFEIYQVVRDAFVFGQRMKARCWSGERIPRLFRRGCLTYRGEVHPVADTGGRAAGVLGGRLLHYSDRNLDQYFAKFQRYTTLWALKARSEGRSVGLAAMLLSPPWRVFHNYFLRGAWRDGRLGVVMALLAGAYTLVKYVKLWGLGRALDPSVPAHTLKEAPEPPQGESPR